MGGMQALEWAAHHPERIRAAIPLATTARSSPMLIAFSEVGRQAIYADPNWKDGDYYENGDSGPMPAWPWRAWWATSPISAKSRCTRSSAAACRAANGSATSSRPSFRSKAICDYKGHSFTQRFDANSYLYITKAMDYFDLSRSPQQAEGTANAWPPPSPTRSQSNSWWSASPAIGSIPHITARNWCRALTAAGADVTYLDIESTWGHDAFLLEVETMTRLLSSFVDRVAREEGIQTAAVRRPAADAPRPTSASADASWAS